MSPQRFNPSYEFIQEAIQQPGVLREIEAVAKRVAKRAEKIAASEELPDFRAWVDTGIRPGGRPRSNVVTDSVEQEFGNSNGRKISALRRAAEAD